MDLLQLEHFLAIVEERTFTRAAERVSRTQPAVSQSIKKLEDEIGAPLFARDVHEVSLTEAGRVLADYARKMVQMRDEAMHRVAELKALRAGTLTLAMIAIYAGFILLIAYQKETMGRLLAPGLSLGILLGALVIVLSWLLTWGYVRWANTHFDTALGEIRRMPLADLYRASPLGVVGVICPWNYPLQNILGPSISALMAGNGVVVKASEWVAWSSARIQRMKG